jgi:single-strand DNA-binding protein
LRFRLRKTILPGNVGADPEIRYTSNGTALARYPLATNHQYTGMVTGDLKEIASWYNQVMYGSIRLNTSSTADM